MARKLKIKRYRDGGGFYRAKPHPVTIVMTILAVGVLVFLGVSIYAPVSNFLRELMTPTEPVLDLPPPPTEPVTEAPTAPPTEPEPAYPETRAVYLPPAVLAEEEGLAAVLESLPGTDINTVLVDIKDTGGNVLFNTANRQAAEWGAVAESPLDLAAFAELLRERDLALAVRIHAFQDSVAAYADRENAIQYQNDGWLWLDAASEAAGGRPWLNPYSEGAKQYITALCLEAAEAGANLVLLDSFQYPAGSVANANFGPRAGVVSRADMLRSYREELAAKLEEKGARAAVYLAALSLTEEAVNETRYGGNPLMFAGDTVALGALPGQFPGEEPGAAVELALSLFLSENPGAKYIPLLGGDAEVQAQIGAVKARGISEYILYAEDGDYAL